MHGLERETLNMKQEKENLIYGFHTFISSVLEIVFSCHDPRKKLKSQLVWMDVLFLSKNLQWKCELFVLANRLHVHLSTLGV